LPHVAEADGIDRSHFDGQGPLIIGATDGRFQFLVLFEDDLAAVKVQLAQRGRVERSMSWTARFFSNSWTIWLAADCVNPQAAAACEKLRKRAMSQNTCRAFICMWES
jgi:hypothetical protein